MSGALLYCLLLGAPAEATERSPSLALGAGAVMAVDPSRAGPAVAWRLSWPVARRVEADVDLSGWTLEGTRRVNASTEWLGVAGAAFLPGRDAPGFMWRVSAGPALLAVRRPSEASQLGFGAAVAPAIGWQSRRPTFQYEAILRAAVTSEGSRTALFVGASYDLR
jgi:hypothetical protein